MILQRFPEAIQCEFNNKFLIGNTMNFPITAACQCGQVTYRLFKKPKAVFACHCTECQKLSTAPFSVTAMVDADAIEFQGQLHEWRRSSDSGNPNHAKFCPTCGNRIYHYNPNDTSTIKLKLKPVNFSESQLFEPTAHVWLCEKLSWFEVPEGVQQFQGQP